jgi:ubiquinone/menaquinone biosynthesis C-methylase UbiE
MNLATEYDQWHSRVFEADPDHSDQASPWYRLVCEYLPPVAGKHILEIACGRGGFSRMLASQGACVQGADFSEAAIRIAVERFLPDPALGDRLKYVQCDAQHMQFADRSFDIVISCETIEHIPDPLAAVREMYRVCKPGGALYLTTPNYLNLIGLYDALFMLGAKRKSCSAFEQPLDRHTISYQTRALLRRAGWRIVASDGTVHQVPVKGRNPVTLNFLDRKRFLRRLLRNFALHYMLVGIKPEPA